MEKFTKAQNADKMRNHMFKNKDNNVCNDTKATGIIQEFTGSKSNTPGHLPKPIYQSDHGYTMLLPNPDLPASSSHNGSNQSVVNGNKMPMPYVRSESVPAIETSKIQTIIQTTTRPRKVLHIRMKNEKLGLSPMPVKYPSTTKVLGHEILGPSRSPVPIKYSSKLLGREISSLQLNTHISIENPRTIPKPKRCKADIPKFVSLTWVRCLRCTKLFKDSFQLVRHMDEHHKTKTSDSSTYKDKNQIRIKEIISQINNRKRKLQQQLLLSMEHDKWETTAAKFIHSGFQNSKQVEIPTLASSDKSKYRYRRKRLSDNILSDNLRLSANPKEKNKQINSTDPRIDKELILVLPRIDYQPQPIYSKTVIDKPLSIFPFPWNQTVVARQLYSDQRPATATISRKPMPKLRLIQKRKPCGFQKTKTPETLKNNACVVKNEDAQATPNINQVKEIMISNDLNSEIWDLDSASALVTKSSEPDAIMQNMDTDTTCGNQNGDPFNLAEEIDIFEPTEIEEHNADGVPKISLSVHETDILEGGTGGLMPTLKQFENIVERAMALSEQDTNILNRESLKQLLHDLKDYQDIPFHDDEVEAVNFILRRPQIRNRFLAPAAVKLLRQGQIPNELRVMDWKRLIKRQLRSNKEHKMKLRRLIDAVLTEAKTHFPTVFGQLFLSEKELKKFLKTQMATLDKKIRIEGKYVHLT